jgi:quinoprotein dehydrogenase-associated probable ABC transporter substrate-binding protein
MTNPAQPASLLYKALAICALATPLLQAAELRVCADPNNMPFSNKQQQGFENRIADLLARDLGATVHYTWLLERRNYVRNTLQAGRCDVLLGVPAGMEGVLTTRPYYRSEYVLVYRAERGLNIDSLYDPALAKLRIGVHIMDENYAPPAFVLAKRGIVRNVVPYSLYGEAGEPNPPAKIFAALDRGDIDTAIVWGPFAGYYAHLRKPPLKVVPIREAERVRAIPLAYDIAIGVRKSRQDLEARIQKALDRDRARVKQILAAYHVPRGHGV